MLEKIAHKLTRNPKLVAIIAVLLLIPSILGAAATHINYDILSYLPEELDSVKGEALLEEPFRVEITATVTCTGVTGVEMEALTAVSAAALTIYDMCKAIQKDMRIEHIRLLSKSGGKSGDYKIEE